MINEMPAVKIIITAGIIAIGKKMHVYNVLHFHRSENDTR
jgi:hypothetical protein